MSIQHFFSFFIFFHFSYQFPLPPCCLPPVPPPIQSLELRRPPLGNPQCLAYQVEARLTTYPDNVSHHRECDSKNQFRNPGYA